MSRIKLQGIFKAKELLAKEANDNLVIAKANLLSSSKFKKGQKVLYSGNGGYTFGNMIENRKCLVYSVFIYYGSIQYELVTPKADGTMPINRKDCIYHAEEKDITIEEG